MDMFECVSNTEGYESYSHSAFGLIWAKALVVLSTTALGLSEQILTQWKGK